MRGNGQRRRVETSRNTEIEWQFDALDLRPVRRWLAAHNGLAAAAPNAQRQLAGPSTRALQVAALAPPPPGVALSASRAGHPSVVPGLQRLDGGPATEGIRLVRSDAGASPAPVVAVAPGVPRQLADIYYDTEDWRVGRAGFVLRLRRKGAGSEMTLKSLEVADGGPRRRIELTERLDESEPAHLGPHGEVGRRVQALVGRRSLHPVLDVRTQRLAFALSMDGSPVGEVVLDETAIDVGDGGPPARLRRVEIEVSDEAVEPLTPFVAQLQRDCHLQEAMLTKFEAGLLAAGLAIPGPPDLGSTVMPPEPSVGDVAYTVLRRNVAAMLAHEMGTRLGEDPEELHDMRVATRRLRAALVLFVDALPPSAPGLRRELGWLAAVLGAARDLDVQLERPAVWRCDVPAEDVVSLQELGDLLEDRRHQAYADLLAALDSPRFEHLAASLVELLRAGPVDDGPGAAPARLAAPDLVARPHRSARKAAVRARQSGAAEDRHDLRIRCKRLRYALEFFADVYNHDTDDFVRVVVELQDLLGALQDAEVAIERLRELSVSGNTLPPSTVFAMGSIAQRYREEKAELLRDLPGALQRLDGKRWARLWRRLENQRSVAALEAGSVAPSMAGFTEPALNLGVAPDAPPALAVVAVPAPTQLSLATDPGVRRNGAPDRPGPVEEP